jgi:adenylate kinase family enzyme
MFLSSPGRSPQADGAIIEGMRIAIIGNSGSGKSTLAAWLATRSGATLLDLDTVAWVQNSIAVARPAEEAQSDVRAFCAARTSWVVEGCYANLVQASLQFAPRLLFLNPGEQQCFENCRARPWEPHKYASKQEQDKRLDFLLSWVAEYYTRTGEMSLSAHIACFNAYPGEREEVRVLPGLEPPSREVLSWISS